MQTHRKKCDESPPTTIAEKLLRNCGFGQESSLELIALVREGRFQAAWDFFHVLFPDSSRRRAIILRATRLASLVRTSEKKEQSIDDTFELVEKCLAYLNS
jgi:hypothetical protein